MSLKNRLNKFIKPLNIQVHGLGYLQALSKGAFKKDEFGYFKELFGNKNPVIFDVGANRGNTIATYLNYFPDAKIYAFEPVPTLIEEIRERFGLYKNVIVEQAGISAVTQKLPFYLNKSIDTSSLLPSKRTGLNSDAQVVQVSTIQVPVITLDDYVSTNKIEKIDILKLDIQGSELNALKGASRMLGEKKIEVIYTEAYFIQQYVGQPLFHEIATLLYGFGYQLQDLYNPIYGKGKLAWCDTVFVKK